MVHPLCLASTSATIAAAVKHVPKDIRAERDAGRLVIEWSASTARLPFRYLRGNCGCAHCVNEWTGARMVDEEAIDPGVSVEAMNLVGGYALKISWTDGHDTGLYTWERLAELAELYDQRQANQA